MNVSDRTIARRRKYLLAGILAVALAARVLTARSTWVIFADSIHFIEMAEKMTPTRLEIAAGVDHHVFHPLYPIFMASVRDVAHFDLVTAGQIVSVALGFASIIPLFFIARHLFGTTAAICTAALFAVHPDSLYHAADVMSEATFLFFVLASVAIAIPVMTRRSWVAAALSGAAAALAYLARPEGGVPMLVMAVALAVAVCRGVKGAAACLVAGLAGFALFAGPYVVHISTVDGVIKPEVTLKKPLWRHDQAAWAGASKAVEVEPSEKKEKAAAVAWRLPKEYLGSLFYFNLLFVIIGVPLSIAHRDRMGPASRFVVWVMITNVVVACLLLFAVGYLSSRHMIAFTVLTIAWAGYGLAHAAVWLRDRAGFKRLSAAGAVIVLCLAAMAAHVPKIAKPRQWDQLGLKSAGLYIKSFRLGPLDRVITNMSQVLYYAGLESSNGIIINDPGRFTREELMDTARRASRSGCRVRFLVIPYKKDKAGGNCFKDFIDSHEYGEPVYVFGDERLRAEYGINRNLPPKRRIYVYEVPEPEEGR